MAIGYARVIDMFEDIYATRKIKRAQRNAEHPESMGYIVPYLNMILDEIKIEGINRVSKNEEDKLVYVVYGKSSITSPVINTLNFVTGDMVYIILADNVIDDEKVHSSINNLMLVFSKLTPQSDTFQIYTKTMKFICSLYILSRVDVEIKDKLVDEVGEDHKRLIETIFDEFYGDHYDMIYDLQTNKKILDVGEKLMGKLKI
jgi:hypothetical protein|nr:MAG TPA: hypothetical protein [Caudoviricetes sp.]